MQTRLMISIAAFGLLLSPLSYAASVFHLPEGSPGVVYSHQIKMKANSGTPPFTFAVSAGALPAGLSLTATGVIQGTPTTAETGKFSVTVTDAASGSVIRAYELLIKGTPLAFDDDDPGTARLIPPIERDKALIGSAPKGATVSVTISSKSHPSVQATAVADATNSFSIPVTPLTADDTVSMSVESGGGVFTTVKTVQPVELKGEEAVAIIGFDQSGASAAEAKQAFFFNFYINRPLPAVSSANLRWWGNVRVASVPQQITSPVGTFVSTFAQNVAQLPVNELAQSAEFVTGLEYRLPPDLPFPLPGINGDRQRMRFALFFGGGATGPLEPKKTLQIFETPAASSPQRERFDATFPGATGSQYIGFISPDRDRFLRQYSAGIRLTTHYADLETGVPLSASPALISFSVGQNEVVTGGHLSGWVGRIEAFYPLPIGSTRQPTDWKKFFSGIYLFGAASFKMSGASNVEPFVLKPADPSVLGSDSNVAIVSVASNRDVYRIGVGVDLTRILAAWKASSDSKPAPPQ